VKSAMIPICYYHSPGQIHIYMSVVVKNKNMNFVVCLAETRTKSTNFLGVSPLHFCDPN
jgi:hypothetical protein